MGMRIYSKISKAFWCSSKGKFESADIPEIKIWEKGPEEVFC